MVALVDGFAAAVQSWFLEVTFRPDNLQIINRSCFVAMVAHTYL